MLHDVVVTMRINADVACKDRTMTHDFIEDTMDVRETCYSVNDRISTLAKFVGIAIEPMPVLYSLISRIKLILYKSIVCHNFFVLINNNETILVCNVLLYRFYVGIAFNPLLGIAVLLHYIACSINN